MVLEVVTGGSGGPKRNTVKAEAKQVPNKEIQMLQNQVDRLTMDNANQEAQNKEVRESIAALGYPEEADEVADGEVRNSLVSKVGSLIGTLVKNKRNNEAKYAKIDGISKEQVQQLCKLDLTIDKLFEIQMKKRNKNDEMIRNKIGSLNEKPSLRKYLFKKVSDEQLAKDLATIQREVYHSYAII